MLAEELMRLRRSSKHSGGDDDCLFKNPVSRIAASSLSVRK